MVDDAVVEKSDVVVAAVRVVLPASRVLEPILIAPKPGMIEPEPRAPTEVSDELTTLEPSVVEFNARTLLMRNAPPVARLTFPPAREMPPENVEVALLPWMVVVAEPPIATEP